jgi:hypothetical protein
MERVMDDGASCGVAAAFWLAMMLFLSRCCVCGLCHERRRHDGDEYWSFGTKRRRGK